MRGLSLRRSFAAEHRSSRLLSRYGEQEASQGKKDALHLRFFLSLPRFLAHPLDLPTSKPLFSSNSKPTLSENLEENERIKAELNPTAIEEPKTPWHGAADSDDEEGGSAGGLGNGSGGSNGGKGPRLAGRARPPPPLA